MSAPTFKAFTPVSGNRYEITENLSEFAENGKLYRAFARAKDVAGNVSEYKEIGQFRYYDDSDVTAPEFFNRQMSVQADEQEDVDIITLSIDCIDQESGVKQVTFWSWGSLEDPIPSNPFYAIETVSEPSGNNYSITFESTFFFNDIGELLPNFSSPQFFFAIAEDFLGNKQVAIFNASSPYDGHLDTSGPEVTFTEVMAYPFISDIEFKFAAMDKSLVTAPDILVTDEMDLTDPFEVDGEEYLKRLFYKFPFAINPNGEPIDPTREIPIDEPLASPFLSDSGIVNSIYAPNMGDVMRAKVEEFRQTLGSKPVTFYLQLSDGQQNMTLHKLDEIRVAQLAGGFTVSETYSNHIDDTPPIISNELQLFTYNYNPDNDPNNRRLTFLMDVRDDRSGVDNVMLFSHDAQLLTEQDIVTSSAKIPIQNFVLDSTSGSYVTILFDDQLPSLTAHYFYVVAEDNTGKKAGLLVNPGQPYQTYQNVPDWAPGWQPTVASA